MTRFAKIKVINAMFTRKTSKLQVIQNRTKTDTGSQVENTKAFEITQVKELGKMVP